MATVIRTLRDFSGDDDNDVTKWLQESTCITTIAGLCELKTLQVLMMKLKGSALTWLTQMKIGGEIKDFDEFRNGLEKRFSTQCSSERILRRFLAVEVVKNQLEFDALLRDATTLYERECVKNDSLYKLTINKIPDVGKPILYQFATTSSGWQNFVARAGEISWLLFNNNKPEKQVKDDEECNLSQIKDDYKQKNKTIKDKNKDKSCRIHGRCAHSTGECYEIKKIIGSLGYVKEKSRRTINSISEPEDDLNKKSDLCFSNKSKINPFYKKIKIGNIKHDALIDTGADISIIHRRNVPKWVKTEKCKRKVTTACGNKIDLTERVIDLKAEIEKTEFEFHPMITNTKPDYTIVGSDVIKNNPKLLNFNTQEAADVNLIMIENVNNSIKSLLNRFSSCFSESITESKMCNTTCHNIETGRSNPISVRNFRVPIYLEDEINTEIENMLKQGIIQPSTSPWCSRVVPIRKKNGKLRLCVDYRALNAITVKDAYPMPRIDEIIDSLADAKIFSTLDATTGYYQIPMKGSDMCKTAFAWKSGLYQYTRMPFGLCNAPASFQRAMDKIFQKEKDNFVIPYLDDIIIYSKSIKEHLKHLEIVFGKIKAAGLSLNKSKCQFIKKEVMILGNIVGSGMVKPDPEKLKAINECVKPKTIKMLRSFLGLASYCREYVPHFARIAAPLNALLKGETKRSIKKINWDEEAEKAFIKLKKHVLNGTHRSQPNFNQQFILTTDASNEAIGAILAQEDENRKRNMIYAFSRKLDQTQSKYSTTDKELLALVKGIEHFRHFLLGREFIVETDHKALQYLWTNKNLNTRLFRWALRLQEYSFIPRYIKGEVNPADILSRPTECIDVISDDQKLSKEEKNEVLRQYHEMLGHGSAYNMKFSINNKYSWNGINKDIYNYCKTCKTCLKSGFRQINTKNRIFDVKVANELWVIDLIGRLKGEDGTNKFIFVAIDHFTKWIETGVVKSKNGATISTLIEKLIIKRHGIPQKILSDNGLEFRNEEINVLIQKYNINWVYSSPEHHETVGVVERVNQTLMKKLRKLCNYGEKPWENFLIQATTAVNASYNRSIRTSPYIIKNGRTPVVDIDNRLGVKQQIVTKIEAIENRNKHFQAYAKKYIEKGRKTSKNNFCVGDKVLVYRNVNADKFRTGWRDDYTVCKHILPDAYIVEKDGASLRVNKNSIKMDLSKGGGVVI
ncbi:MAG: reverse transcriptase domain-containing protein [Aeromonas sp.]